jgi:calcineurin-like phosphoesterase family protein
MAYLACSLNGVVNMVDGSSDESRSIARASFIKEIEKFNSKFVHDLLL